MSQAMNSNCPAHGRTLFMDGVCQRCWQAELKQQRQDKRDATAEMKRDFLLLSDADKFEMLFDTLMGD